MQTLIALATFLSVTSAAQFKLIPYAYLSDPLPVYHQSQDTRTGEHAYSYSGGPSAKEEVKGPDGVTRGSYSYVDAHGILQSVFYTADENGFRVAATNLPTDENTPVHSPVLESVENEAASNSGATPLSRKRRSLDLKDEEVKPEVALGYPILLPEFAATATSHQSRFQEHKNVKLEAPYLQDAEYPAYAETVLASKVVQEPKVFLKVDKVEDAYSPVVSVPLATSHQSTLQLHDSLRRIDSDFVQIERGKDSINTGSAQNLIHFEDAKPEVKIGAKPILGEVREASSPQIRGQIYTDVKLDVPEKVLTEESGEVAQPLYQSIPYSVPLATSHQSRLQVHESIRVEPETPNLTLKEHEEPVGNYISHLSGLGYPSYHENRIALHKTLGLEGPSVKNAIKIHQTPVAVPEAILEQSNTAVPSAVTAYSNQRRFQIYKSDKLELEHTAIQEPFTHKAIVQEPVAQDAIIHEPAPIAVAQPAVTAYSNQRRFQIHNSNTIELEQPTVFEPIAQKAIIQEPIVQDAIIHQPAPIAVAQPVITAYSNQRRFQIHNSNKIELEQPTVVEPVAQKAIIQEPVVQDAIIHEPVPLDVSHPLVTAYSNQRRFQIHNSNKIELEQPTVLEPVAQKAIIQEPIAQDAIIHESVPIAVSHPIATAYSNQRKFQVHSNNNIELDQPVVQEAIVQDTIPVAVGPSVTTAFSNQRRFQIHQSNKLELEHPFLTSSN